MAAAGDKNPTSWVATATAAGAAASSATLQGGGTATAGAAAAAAGAAVGLRLGAAAPAAIGLRGSPGLGAFHARRRRSHAGTDKSSCRGAYGSGLRCSAALDTCPQHSA